jgi:hypothetical protein
VAGYPTTRDVCVSCGQKTRSAVEPGLAIPAPRPQGPSQAATLNKGVDIGSRVIFGGFWSVVALGALVGGVAILTQGNAVGLLVIGVGILAALYARYIFRGGRFRILFW